MRHIRLAVKLPALIVLAVVITAATGGGLAIYLSRSVMRAATLAADAESVRSYADAIAFYLDASRTDLEAAADSAVMLPSSPRSFTSEREALPTDGARGKREMIARALRHSAAFEYLILLRADGSVDVIEPRDFEARLSRRDLGFMTWYRDVLTVGRTVVSDLHISPVTQRPTVIIATPVRDADGDITAVLAGALRLEILSQVGRASEAGAPRGYAYLTDSRGLIVAYQAKAKHVIEQTDFSSVPPVQAALAGRDGILQFVDPIEGEEKLGAYMPLPGTGWAAVYSAPIRVAFAPIGWLTNSIALTSAAMAVLFGLGGIVLARQIVRPVRRLAARAAQIAAGDFAQPIEVETTDEVGKLAAEFNRMADALARNEARLRGANEALEVQYQRAQAANQLKSAFLANMSHELRTPLNGIIGFTELMHDGKVGPITSEQLEYMGDVLRSAHHLLELINGILDLSKIESGKMEFFPEAVDLAGLVTEVTATVGPLAAQKRIRPLVEIDPDLTGIVADPAKLKQVFYNYLSNALKFTREAGRVTIRILAEGPDRFRVEVEDTGVGIEPEDIDRLFQQFQQLDGGVTKKYAGTGIGLALTKRIVEAQGGRVGVESTFGAGSLFFAVLPRISRPVKDDEAAADRPLRGLRVLVIEDDARDRVALAQTLTEAACTVETARTGTEALALARLHVFDVITLAVLLPDTNGRDVLAEIRRDGPNRETPAILITTTPEQGLGAGSPLHGVLVKPVERDTLLASVHGASLAPTGSGPILVVDDDPQSLTLAEKALRQRGYRTVCRSGAEEALEAAGADPPAAVVLDLLMPEIDGFEFLRRLRWSAGGRRTPVIVWTMKDLSPAEREKLAGAAQAVVSKSAGLAALIEQIHAHVPLPRA